MSDSAGVGTTKGEGGDPRRSLLPNTAMGWWAVWPTIGAVATMFFVLPTLTATLREIYPVTDTWVMPAIGSALLYIAAIVGVLAVWRARERSVVGIAAVVLSVLLALFATVVLVGGAVTGQ